MADLESISMLKIDQDSAIYKYCECANQIKFGSDDESSLAEANLDNLYKDLTTESYRIPFRSAVVDPSLSSAWMAASSLCLSGIYAEAKEWAKFVELDPNYQWLDSHKEKILAKAAMRLILDDDSQYLAVRNAWFLSSRFEPKYLSFADKQWIYVDLKQDGVPPTLRIMGFIYLSVLDVYEHLWWNEPGHVSPFGKVMDHAKVVCDGANDM